MEVPDHCLWGLKTVVSHFTADKMGKTNRGVVVYVLRFNVFNIIGDICPSQCFLLIKINLSKTERNLANVHIK